MASASASASNFKVSESGGNREVAGARFLVEDYTGSTASDAHPIRTALLEGADGVMLDDDDDESSEGKSVEEGGHAGARKTKPTGAPALASVANLCNSAIGAGVLSLPFAFRRVGLGGGVVLTACIGCAEAFTLYVLTKMAERYKAESYSQLVRATLGKKMATFLCILMVVYMWGACNAYIVIMADVFESLAVVALGEGHWATSRSGIIAVVGCFVLLPLCFIKQLSHLSSLSSFAVCGFLFTAGVVMKTAWEVAEARGPGHKWDGVDMWNFDLSALYALPIVVFGFNCHANAVPIFQELAEDKSEQLFPALNPRRKTSKLINMISVIAASIGLIMVGYLAVGCAGYFAYPDSVTGNVLNALPAGDPWVQAARGLIGIVVVGHYPLNHHPARAGALDLAALAGFSSDTIRNTICPTFTAVFTLSSILVSMFCTDLGSVVHTIGGTAAACLIFFMPGLMLINAAIIKHSTGMLRDITRRHQDSLQASSFDGNAPAAAPSGEPTAEEDALRVPFLNQAVRKGIKKTGLVYSPRKSWIAGLVLVLFAVFIFTVTMVTTMTG